MSRPWYVYLLRNEKGALYAGITLDLERRFDEHCESPTGAKYMRTCRELELVYSCRVGDRSLAARVEYRIKKMKKADKEVLVSEAPTPRRLLSMVGL
jgi:putative endonuclease